MARFSKVLEIEPDNTDILTQRAMLHLALREPDGAADDARRGVRANPGAIDLHIMLANLARGRGDLPDALARIEAMKAANPNSARALVAASTFHVALNRRDLALPEAERALAIEPAAYVHLALNYARRKSDIPARRADLDMALKLDPDLVEATRMKSDLLVNTNDYAGAIAVIEQSSAIRKDDPDTLIRLGVANARLGKAALADGYFAEARARAKGAAGLNSLCWTKATWGVVLESALADCDAALAIEPRDAATLDSRGLVLLRLGRLEERSNPSTRRLHSTRGTPVRSTRVPSPGHGSATRKSPIATSRPR